MTNKIDWDYCIDAIQNAEPYVPDALDDGLATAIEAIKCGKELESKADKFDVLEAMRDRTVLIDEKGRKWVYDSAHGYCHRESSASVRRMTWHDLAYSQFKPYKEPTIEDMLEEGKIYICKWGAHHVCAIYKTDKWKSTLDNGAFYAKEHIKPILTNGKPVPIEVPEGD